MEKQPEPARQGNRQRASGPEFPNGFIFFLQQICKAGKGQQSGRMHTHSDSVKKTRNEGALPQVRKQNAQADTQKTKQDRAGLLNDRLPHQQGENDHQQPGQNHLNEVFGRSINQVHDRTRSDGAASQCQEPQSEVGFCENGTECAQPEIQGLGIQGHIGQTDGTEHLGGRTPEGLRKICPVPQPDCNPGEYNAPHGHCHSPRYRTLALLSSHSDSLPLS